MVKINHVKGYLKAGIIDEADNCEDVIESEFSNETVSSFDVEFTDWSMSGNKSKYRIIIEHLD